MYDFLWHVNEMFMYRVVCTRWHEEKMKLQGENDFGVLQIKIPDGTASNMNIVMRWWKYDLSTCVIKA